MPEIEEIFTAIASKPVGDKTGFFELVMLAGNVGETPGGSLSKTIMYKTIIERKSDL